MVGWHLVDLKVGHAAPTGITWGPVGGPRECGGAAGRARLPQKMPPTSIWSPQWDRNFLRIPPYGYPEEQ